MGASLHVHSEPLISIKLIHVWLDILTIKIKIKNKKKSNVFDGSFDCYTLYFKFTTDDLNLLTFCNVGSPETGKTENSCHGHPPDCTISPS